MRKNVLIFGHDYNTPFVDVFNQYTRLFDKNKFCVTVAYLTGEPNDDIKNNTLAEEVIFLNIPKKNIRSLKVGAIKKLLAFTREKQFQIVICHRYKPSYIMMWVAKFHKIPALISVMHELRTMSSINRQMVIAALARKNMIFAGVSNAVRNDMRKNLWFVPDKRIITLYNVIDAQLVEPQLLSRAAARNYLSLSDDEFVFGNLGRLVKNKDQESLIRAFALIKPACPKAKLVIIGAGELEPHLKHIVTDCGLQESVIFTGFLSGGFRYMKAFDCFVLSSTQEAFGRVLLEAMLARLPIIATKAHGIPEVVDDAGKLVQPKDVPAMAAAMQEIYLLSESDRITLANKAYERAINEFSIARFQEQFWGATTLTS